MNFARIQNSLDKAVIVDGYGAKLFVERGHLVINDGFVNEGESRELRFPRGRCGVERILVRAAASRLMLWTGVIGWGSPWPLSAPIAA